MKYPGSVYKKPNPNWEYIEDYYLYYLVLSSLFTLTLKTLNCFDLTLKIEKERSQS